MNVDARTLLLNGWMREYLEWLRLDPHLFSTDLLNYFAIWLDLKQGWREDIISYDLIVHEQTGIIRKEKDNYGYSTGFGRLCIRKGECVCWNLQIFTGIYAAKCLNIFVGIVNVHQYDYEKELDEEDRKHRTKLFHSKGYALHLGDRRLYCDQGESFIKVKQKREIVSGDIIHITLDLTGDAGILTYEIKDCIASRAFNNINCSQQYCLAVSWRDQSNKFRLLNP